MADLNVQPVGTQVKPIQGMSLGEMMNFARGAQQYQQGGITLSLEKQKERERNALTEFFSKPENFQTNGRVDINKLNAEIPKIAPLTGTEYISGLTTLSGAQSEAQQKGIALSVDQQKEIERNQMQTFLAKPENFQTNGRIDLDKLNSAVTKLAPLTGADYIQKFTTLGSAQTQAIDAKQKLTQDQRNMIGQRFAMLGRLGVQDKNVYLAEMDLLKKENPDNPDLHKLIDAYKTTWQDIQSGENLPSMAIAGANTLLSIGTQQEKFAPRAGTATTGAATFQTTEFPSVAGERPEITVSKEPLVTTQLLPGQREQPTGRLDINNQPTFFRYGPDGRFLGEFTVSGTPAEAPGGQRPVVTSQMPAAEPVARIRPGETLETMTAANKIRMDASNAALQVPNQIENNNKIIALADKVITGKGANFIGALSGGYAGLPFTTDNATNLNQLGHYMALQTASLSQSSGLGGTDAARGIAGEISGTAEWTAPAIKQTARVNRALSTATELFNQGVQKAFEKNKDPFSARDFQNKWAGTVNIKAIRLYDAMKNKDNEAIREIVNEVGGQNSPGYKDLIDNIGKTKKLLGGQ